MGAPAQPHAGSVTSLARAWRRLGPVLLAQADQPHDELLTLLWGPQFDRQHALRLCGPATLAAPASAGVWWPVLMQAADAFDALAPAAQQRARRAVLRHARLTRQEKRMPQADRRTTTALV